MGYFSIGLLLASFISIVLLLAPIRGKARNFIANIMEDTMLSDCFITLSEEDPELDDLIGSAFFGTFLWTLLIAAIWLVTFIIWPLLAPAFIILIIVWRKYSRRT